MTTADAHRTAVFPGSFDPVTRGHLDIIERAARLFDRLVVGVLENPAKSGLLEVSERVALLQAEVGGLGAVEVRAFRGLTVQLAAAVGATWIVRGVRSGSDAAYELPMAHSNRLCGDAPEGAEAIETVLIPTRPELAFISSTLVRQIAAEGGHLDAFVTPGVARALGRRAK